MQDIIVTEDILQDIAKSEADFCRRVRKCDPMEGARNIASEYKASFRRVEHIAGKNKLESLKVLEIGSGNGFLLCYALKNGIDIVGIEPGKTYGFQDRFSRAIKLLQLNEIQSPGRYLLDASSENIPFDNNTFDVVFATVVLEHVNNIELSMKEMLRVLKPGGVLFASLPNINSFYEGHYDILWMPYMNKKIAKLYVETLFNRDPSFIDELHFTVPSMFKKYLKSNKTNGYINLYGIGLFKYIFIFYNILSGARSLTGSGKYKWLKLLLYNKLIRFLLKHPFLILCKLFQLAGFAGTFDIVLYKKENQ